MFSVRRDLKNNVLNINFRGVFDERQGEKLIGKIQEQLPKLKEGFKILTDLSDLDNMEANCRPYIEKTMDLCNQHGVDTIVRVIPDKSKDIGFSIMSLFHYSKEVKIYTCNSFEEATQYLVLLRETTFLNRAIILLKVAKAKVIDFSASTACRLIIISSFFICLVVLRRTVGVFGASLGYLYVTVISLAGFWFRIKGGFIAALTASLVFLAEVSLFRYWPERDIVVKSMHLRFLVYFFSGVMFGYLAQIEEQLRKKLEFLAGHDELTGCYNFRFLMRLLEKEIMRSKRYEKGVTVSIIDIDHFKTLNDKYGHLVGNDVLKTFTQVIMTSVRAEDMVGRYGGDELLIIFPESTAQQAAEVLKRIKTKLAQRKMVSSYISSAADLNIKFSAGISSFPAHGVYIDKLIHAADNALYKAKSEGRNRIVVENI